MYAATAAVAQTQRKFNDVVVAAVASDAAGAGVGSAAAAAGPAAHNIAQLPLNASHGFHTDGARIKLKPTANSQLAAGWSLSVSILFLLRQRKHRL